MKNHETSMQRMYTSLMCFEHGVGEKTSFLKKVKARRPLYSCSRIRVGEGSPKEEGSHKFRSMN